MPGDAGLPDAVGESAVWSPKSVELEAKSRCSSNLPVGSHFLENLFCGQGEMQGLSKQGGYVKRNCLAIGSEFSYLYSVHTFFVPCSHSQL